MVAARPCNVFVVLRRVRNSLTITIIIIIILHSDTYESPGRLARGYIIQALVSVIPLARWRHVYACARRITICVDLPFDALNDGDAFELSGSYLVREN